MSAADNLENNNDRVAYTSYSPLDKIVATYSGSFVVGTDTVTRSYTLAGFPNVVNVFRIPHGLSRPVFVESQWSVDGSAYFEGGGTPNASDQGCIAYSDRTYVYIMSNGYITAGTRVYYRVVCDWIEDFDQTNPDVPGFISGQNVVNFYSGWVAARVLRQGVANVSTTSPTTTNVLTTVDHNLGYAPEVRVYIESFADEVWPLNYGGLNNLHLVDDSQVECQVFSDATSLAINTVMKAANGSRRVWYRLYGKRGDYITAITVSALNV